VTDSPDRSAADPERDPLDVRGSAPEQSGLDREGSLVGRGRLRVYLGMAPGVGKTWRMLEEGHRRLARGTDVVVGFVEVHGRWKTTDLLDGLEIVPRRRVEHRGIVIEEMDIDAVLARRPTVVLIDELAHTNIHGSAHAYRWEDVDVLLDAGVHVVSTMNIQHLERAADAAATITGAPVIDRLPDAVLLGADEIELVDMSPHALRQRILHGNVFPAERVPIALEKTYTEANLTALRELVLRFAAERVDRQLRGDDGQAMPTVSDRVIVLVDGSPASLRAVRRAARLAGALHAPLDAVVIETLDSSGRSIEHRRNLRDVLDDAVDLGAEVVPVEAKEVVQALEDVAQARRATHIVLPHLPVAGIARVIGRSRIDRLLERLPEVEVVVVSER